MEKLIKQWIEMIKNDPDFEIVGTMQVLIGDDAENAISEMPDEEEMPPTDQPETSR